jgi:phosphate transport system substrate-binding protein
MNPNRPTPRAARAALRTAVTASCATLLVAAVVLGGCGQPRARNITLKGSDTMVLLGQKWSDEYMKAHPGSVVAVTGGGSGTGIAQLIDGTIDIAQSSRIMKDEEKAKIAESTGAPVAEHVVARDGVTVYVHTSNPLTQVTMEQLKGIYTGAITNWKDLGGPDQPITVYSRENNSGTYVFFKEHVLGGDDFMAAAQTLPGTAAVVNAVTQDPKGIGYGGIAFGGGVRHVAIVGPSGTAVEPNEQSIRDGSYALSRPLYWYLTAKAPEPARALAEWVKGPEGQKLVAEVGYFPVQ